MYLRDDVAALVDLFLRFNRRLMFIVHSIPHELSVNESQVLMEVVAKPGITARECSELLGIEKSILSRTIGGLERRKLLRRESSSEDARQRKLIILADGVRTAHADIDIRNRMASECISPLPPDERARLCQYLHSIADALEAASIETRTEDEPAKIAIRRLTRSMGFLGDDFLGTGMNIERYQLLSLIGKSGAPTPLQYLRHTLPYDVGTISHIVSDFVREEIIRREVSPDDHRGASLSLTEKGEGYSQTSLQRACAFLSRGLRLLTQDEQRDLTSLLRGFLETKDLQSRNDLAGRMLVLPVRNEEERAKCRAFVIDELVHRGQQTSVPGHFLVTPHIARMLAIDGKISGVCEATRVDGRWNFTLFVVQASCALEFQELLVSEVKLGVAARKGAKSVSSASPFLGQEALRLLDTH